MPSFFNGIFGHKPSPEIVPNSGQFPDATGNRQQFLCTGPMCRYAQDLKPLLRVCTLLMDVLHGKVFGGVASLTPCDQWPLRNEKVPGQS